MADELQTISIPELGETSSVGDMDFFVVRQAGQDKRISFLTIKESSVNPATTTTVGVVRLNDTLTSSSTTEAATANSSRVLSVQIAGAVSRISATEVALGGKANTVHTHSAADVVSGVFPIVRGGTGATSATQARANLELGTISTLNSISNSNWSGAALSIVNGGTGATSATQARANLGLSSVATLSVIPIINGGTGATSAEAARGNLGMASHVTQEVISIINGGTGANSASQARVNLGLGSLATLSSINNSNWSGAVLSIVNGGTGASSAAQARNNLGLGGVATLNNIPISYGGTGANSASQARVNLGLGSLATLNFINNSNWSGASLSIANGGTGATTASQARINLGLKSLATKDSITFNEVSGVLPLNKGGTGGNTAAAARTNLGLNSQTTTVSRGVTGDLNSFSLTLTKTLNIVVAEFSFNVARGSSDTTSITGAIPVEYRPARTSTGLGVTTSSWVIDKSLRTLFLPNGNVTVPTRQADNGNYSGTITWVTA